MRRQSCKNCQSIEWDKKEEKEGRLYGKYRYGCSRQRSGYICGFVSCDEKLDMLVCSQWLGNMTGEPDYGKLAEAYAGRLQKLYERWNHWRRNGSPKAEVPDGIYLNRIRKSIEGVMKEVERLFKEEDYPDFYYAPLPPVMEEDFMVDCQTIQENAERALNEFESNQDYLWLLEQVQKLKNDDRENTEAYRLLCHADALKQAIADQNYLNMKRESWHKSLYDDLSSCRKRIQKKSQKQRGSRKTKKKEPEIIGQIDLYDLKVS